LKPQPHHKLRHNSDGSSRIIGSEIYLRKRGDKLDENLIITNEA